MGDPDLCSRKTSVLASLARHERNGEARVTKLDPREPASSSVVASTHAGLPGAVEPVRTSWVPARPTWLHRAALPLGILLLTALGGGAVWLRLQFAIERCVEAGGKWASSDRRCTFVLPEQPEPLIARPAGTTVKQQTQ